MKLILKLSVLTLMAACLVSSHLVAEDIVAIFGTGNPDTGWTANSNGDITLALRAKDRATGSTANNFGVYSEDAGPANPPPASVRSKWNWEFSINSGEENLDAYDYYVSIDLDTSIAIAPVVVHALSNPYWDDNSYGDDSTLNGQGVEGTAADNASEFNISQQSQNLVFAPADGDPSANATYDYTLYAVKKGKGPNAKPIVSVRITVIVGSGGDDLDDLIADLAVGVKNHGQYVSAVEKLTKELVASGAISKEQAKTAVNEAAKSSIGKK